MDSTQQRNRFRAYVDPRGLGPWRGTRPIIDWYAAAVAAEGVISTGHAALEVPPDIYISHYPGVEIERSPNQFMHIPKATAENNVPGKFQPSYAEEAAGLKRIVKTIRIT